jgi:hypothetical protein
MKLISRLLMAGEAVCFAQHADYAASSFGISPRAGIRYPERVPGVVTAAELCEPRAVRRHQQADRTGKPPYAHFCKCM